MYKDNELPRIQVGFRIDPMLYNDFSLVAKQLHMTVNQAHVEAIKQFMYAKGTNIIKRQLEIERKNLDALEQYLLQIENQEIIPQEQAKSTINMNIRRDIENYVLRMDRSYHSHHVIEYASSVANTNSLDLKVVLDLIKEYAVNKFSSDIGTNRRLVVIENAIMAVNI